MDTRYLPAGMTVRGDFDRKEKERNGFPVTNVGNDRES
jgi:hypothetical protein